MDGESQDLNEMIEDLENRRKMVETEYLEARHYVDESSTLHKELKEAYQVFLKNEKKNYKKRGKKRIKLLQKRKKMRKPLFLIFAKCNWKVANKVVSKNIS